MHYLLFYDVVAGYAEQRKPYRAAPLAHARQAEAFAAADPYVTHGLVTKWRVREWTTVVGPEAAAPIGPKGSV